MFLKSLGSAKTRFFAIVLLASFLALAGCTTYHKVTDPASKNVYYTKKIKQQKSGAVTFTDDRTGTKVTLQSSEIQKIPRKEYKEAIKKD